MTISIRNREADALARRIADQDRVSITEAVLVALREAAAKRSASETPTQTARRILARHGVKLTKAMRKPAPPGAYRSLDHDLAD
jgi:antitoxin VapB